MRAIASFACRASRLLALVAPSLIAAPNASGSQVIAPRTVPAQQSGQFAFFPTALAGMAGASFVLADTLLDPFVNPARATSVRGLRVFTELASYATTRGGAGGYTVPVGAIAAHGPWA